MKDIFYGVKDPIIKDFHDYIIERKDIEFENIREFCKKRNMQYDENKKEEILTFINCLYFFDKMLIEKTPDNILKYAAIIGEIFRYYFYYKKGWSVPQKGFEGQCLKLIRNIDNDAYKPFFYLLAGVYNLRNKFFGAHFKQLEIKSYEAKVALYNSLWFIVVFSKEENISKNVIDTIQNMIISLESYEKDSGKVHKIKLEIDRIIYAVKHCSPKSGKDIQNYLIEYGCKKIPSTNNINAYLRHKGYRNLFTKQKGYIELTKGEGMDRYHIILESIP